MKIKNEFGHEIKYYQEDNSGIFYALNDSLGVIGIVQCESFFDAHEICEDEFFPEADETIEEIMKEMEIETVEKLLDNACFQEAYGFRPNGPNCTDKMRHGIYQKDLNGDRLERMTVQLKFLDKIYTMEG